MNDIQVVSDIFLRISYAKASQGYSANTILEYFANATEEQISDDYFNELILEDKVSDTHIIEQTKLVEIRLGLLSKLLPKKVASKLTVGKVLKRLGLGAVGTTVAVGVLRPDLTNKVVGKITGTSQKAKDAVQQKLDQLNQNIRDLVPDLSKPGKDEKDTKDSDSKPAEDGTKLTGMSPLAVRQPETVSPEKIAQRYNKMRSSEIATGDTSEVSNRYLARQLTRIQREAYDIVLDYLLAEGHADTINEANYVMLQMSAEHIQNIVEAENYVLAQRTRNGVTVPGIVKVNKTREGGFLGIGSREVSRPVPGSFTPGRISSRAAARYNQAIDQRFGTGSNRNAMPAYRVQQRAKNQGNSGYMRVDNPEEIPNTGAADRPTPQRAGDQNRALDLLRPDVPIDSKKTKPAPKPAAGFNYGVPGVDEFAGIRKFTQVGKPKSKAPETKAPEPKVKAKLAPKPAAPGSSSEPKVKAKLAPKPAAPAPEPRLTKAQQDILDLRQMRANSLNRQGDVAAAQKLQTEVDVARATNKIAATSPTPDLKPDSTEVLKRFNKASSQYMPKEEK